MKSIRLVSILTAVSLLFALCSCLDRAREEDYDKIYTADPYAYVSTHKGKDKNEYQSSLFNGEKYTIGIHVPVTGAEEVDYFLSSLAETAEKDFKNAMSPLSRGEDGSKGVLYGDYILNRTSKYVSVLMTFQTRLPDKDPVTEYYSVFYTLADQKLMTLGDIFDSSYLSPLADLIISALKEDKNLSLHMGEDFYSRLSLTDASATSFFMTDDALTLYFNGDTILTDYSSPLTLSFGKELINPLLPSGMYEKIYEDGALG